MRAAWLPLAAVLLAGCGGAGQVAGIRPPAPAVHAPLCRPPGHACRSPDGEWSVEVAHRPGRLVLTRLATGRQTVGYSSRDACCGDVAWARPHLLFFADDYRVFRLDPATQAVAFVAGFSDFYVSPDGRRLAGYAGAAPREAQNVGVISLATGRCVEVPGGDDYVGSKFGFGGGTPRTGFSPSGAAVIVARPGGRGAVQYPISALRRACPAWMTRQP